VSSRRVLFRIAAFPLAILAFSGIVTLKAQRSSSGYGAGGPVWWVAEQDEILPRQDEYDNQTGQARMVIPGGSVHSKDHPFFMALGSNGRACITCHQPSSAMSVSPAELQRRWDETEGADAVFAAIDGSNCPDLPQKAKSSHSLLLERGLFRIGLAWPPRGEDGKAIAPDFRVEVVIDPTGCNTSKIYGLQSANPEISVFRRPRMTANLKYLAPGPDGLNLMADGRETTLRSQAITAAKVHELANTPSEEQLRRIVEFEAQVYETQGSDIYGGLLNEREGPAALGPENLADGKTPAIDMAAFRQSFDPWRKPAGAGDLGLQLEFRASVARGSDVFSGHQFAIPELGTGTCASCHSFKMRRSTNVGTSIVEADARAARPNGLPLFRITCNTGRVVYTNDPGRALISGKCADVGAFVMQQFHGLAARAPYFANGSAASLGELVEFYERRFHLGLTAEQKKDLTNFLRVL
jgi:cytochrome c peroxidase